MCSESNSWKIYRKGEKKLNKKLQLTRILQFIQKEKALNRKYVSKDLNSQLNKESRDVVNLDSSGEDAGNLSEYYVDTEVGEDKLILPTRS